jgi:hypothetical protein
VSHRLHFEIEIDGGIFDTYGDSMPLGDYGRVKIRQRRTVKPHQAGPNYDGSINSYRAARLYEPARANARWDVWRHLDAVKGGFVSGGVLIDLYGTAALERVRELRFKFGWPIEARPPQKGRGVWWYRLPPPRRYIQRTNGSSPIPD